MYSRILVAALCLSFASRASAHSNGVSGYSGLTGSTCSSCHSGAATNPTASLSGPSTLSAGSSAVYTLTLTGGPAVVGGLDVAVPAASGATLQATDTGTQLMSGEVTHSTPGTYSSGTLSYTFTVVAPATPGSFTIYAAGNSCNGDGKFTGDGTAATTQAVSVVACPANCSACSGSTCTTCTAGYFLSSGSCTACDAGCTSCTGAGAGACTACSTGYTLVSGTCVAPCAAGTYLFGNTCAACATSCATCTTTATNCTSCPGGSYLSSGACVTSCPAGTTASGGTCVASTGGSTGSTSGGGGCGTSGAQGGLFLAAAAALLAWSRRERSRAS